MMAKDVPRQLVPVVVNSYFNESLHTSFEALDHWRQLNRPKLTSPLLLHSGFKSLLGHPTAPSFYKIFKNRLKKHNFFHFFELRGCWQATSYEITETMTATTANYFGPSFIIILNRAR